jgi:hypothetical protein
MACSASDASIVPISTAGVERMREIRQRKSFSRGEGRVDMEQIYGLAQRNPSPRYINGYGVAKEKGGRAALARSARRMGFKVVEPRGVEPLTS